MKQKYTKRLKSFTVGGNRDVLKNVNVLFCSNNSSGIIKEAKNLGFNI